jgi:NitT/TauT family transport system substrate-binding protein
MSGQVDIGFSTPPFGLAESDQGKTRIRVLADDLNSIRTQTVRVTVANATDLAKRPDVYKRFIAAYQEIIDWMYSPDPKVLEMYAKYAKITPGMARVVRDRFYPKSMLQLTQVEGMDALMQDAIAFKYITKPLTKEQLDELLKFPGKL